MYRHLHSDLHAETQGHQCNFATKASYISGGKIKFEVGKTVCLSLALT